MARLHSALFSALIVFQPSWAADRNSVQICSDINRIVSSDRNATENGFECSRFRYIFYRSVHEAVGTKEFVQTGRVTELIYRVNPRVPAKITIASSGGSTADTISAECSAACVEVFSDREQTNRIGTSATWFLSFDSEQTASQVNAQISELVQTLRRETGNKRTYIRAYGSQLLFLDLYGKTSVLFPDASTANKPQSGR